MGYPEQIARHFAQTPQVADSAFIAPGAVVVGDVVLGEEASIWFGCVLRADINQIRIGAHSNVQDGTVVHLESSLPTVLGEYVTVGHKALLHACTVEDECLIGMGSILMDGVHIGRRSIVGAGALVTARTIVPPGSLVLGSPARVVRPLAEEEQAGLRAWAERYVVLSRAYLEGGANFA